MTASPKDEVPRTKLAEKAVFPIFGKTLAQCDPETGVVTVLGGTGMTLLEHYAGLAMQGLAQRDLRISGAYPSEEKSWNYEQRASWSVKMARALIAELEKEAK